MKNGRITIGLAVAAIVVMAAGVQGVTHYNDGGTHFVDHQINDSVHIDEGAAYAEAKTTVDIVEGGSIPLLPNYNYFRAYNQSTAAVSGGSVGGLNAYNSSTVDISGGSANRIEAFDSSSVNVSAGTVNGLFSFGTSSLNVSDGTIASLSAFDTSSVNILGGEVNWRLTASNTSKINISNGHLSEILTRNNSTVDISGGQVNSLLAVDLRSDSEKRIKITY